MINKSKCIGSAFISAESFMMVLLRVLLSERKYTNIVLQDAGFYLDVFFSNQLVFYWKHIETAFFSLKHQPHESDNLDESIVTISCKRVHGATRARFVKRVFVRG